MAVAPPVLADVRDRWCRLRPEIVAHFERLWQVPELPLLKVRAAAALSGHPASHPGPLMASEARLDR